MLETFQPYQIHQELGLFSASPGRPTHKIIGNSLENLVSCWTGGVFSFWAADACLQAQGALTLREALASRFQVVGQFPAWQQQLPVQEIYHHQEVASLLSRRDDCHGAYEGHEHPIP